MNVPRVQPRKVGDYERRQLARYRDKLGKALYPATDKGTPSSLNHVIRDDSTCIMWWRDKDGHLIRNTFRGQTARGMYERHKHDNGFGYELCTGWTLEQIRKRHDELRRRG